jgi:hypothetical protein
MGERRYIHSVNVSKAAVKLAEIYGADAKKAELAGILHDSCKEIDKKLMLQIISNGGIILDDTQKNSSKLWHAIAGSVYVRDTLGINDDDIINLYNNMDTDRNGLVNYTEFISALIDYENNIQIEHLISCFQNYDEDHSGKINFIEFCRILRPQSEEEKKELKKLYDEYDDNGDGEIDVDEFIKGFKKYVN